MKVQFALFSLAALVAVAYARSCPGCVASNNQIVEVPQPIYYRQVAAPAVYQAPTPCRSCPPRYAPVCDNQGVEHCNQCVFNCASDRYYLQSGNRLTMGQCDTVTPAAPAPTVARTEAPAVPTTTTTTTPKPKSGESSFTWSEEYSKKSHGCTCKGHEIIPVCDNYGHQYNNMCEFNCASSKVLMQTGQALTMVDCVHKEAPATEAAPKMESPMQPAPEAPLAEGPAVPSTELQPPMLPVPSPEVPEAPETVSTAEYCASCPATGSPVCDENGQKYPNECLFNCAVKKAMASGVSLGLGQCAKLPQNEVVIPQQPSPKVIFHTKTVQSAPIHLIQQQGPLYFTDVAQCQSLPVAPVCASDGRRFENQCMFECERNKLGLPHTELYIVRKVGIQEQCAQQSTWYQSFVQRPVRVLFNRVQGFFGY